MNTKKLEREYEGAVVAGVLAGLARYFDQDPVLFRIIAIILLVLTGIFPGALLYFVAWLIMPKRTLGTVEYTIIE
ncbi:PspC domain-containing protein [Patescibacteria group bacterium]|nr:PspC domain-containing protein [Patescibacteria group bacterium]